MEIFVEGLSFLGAHGVYPEERREGRQFKVDLRVRTKGGAQDPGATDELAHTLDYRGLAQCIVDVAQGPSCALVEHMAQKIVANAMGRYPEVVWAQVVVKKAAQGVPGDPPWVGVALEQSRP